MLWDKERPINCSEAKRWKFHVKDASDVWVMDKTTKKIDKALGGSNIRQYIA